MPVTDLDEYPIHPSQERNNLRDEYHCTFLRPGYDPDMRGVYFRR